jgi:dTDP-glucose 4,6-dehydratase
MTTLLITGGAGFIGSNLVRYALAHTTHKLVIVDNLTYAGNLRSLQGCLDDARVMFVRADITDAAAMQRVFAEHEPTAVANLAAETHVDRSIDGPRRFVDTNIVGTQVLLEATRQHLDRRSAVARDEFKFLHVSTDEVYGTLGPDGSFSEETPYAPNSPYAASKASADHLVRAYQHTFGVPCVITNCSNNDGPVQFPEKLIPLMILNALDGRSLPIYGDGLNVRDWMFVEDHCEALLLVLDRGRVGEKYNIGGGNERTNIAIVDGICERLETMSPSRANASLKGGAYESLKTYVKDRPAHDRRYAIDASKIARELGWRPRHEFESGLNATVSWYVANRDWCTHVQAGQYDRERLGVGR